MTVDPHETQRAGRRRRGQSVGMYNQVFLRLLVAAIVTFAVIFLAAYFYLVPLGQRSVRAVVPVLDGFAQAAAAGDLVNARRMLSEEYLESERITVLDTVLAQPESFAGYDGLNLERFTMLPRSDPNGPELGSARATLRYADGSIRRLDAVLVLEAERWRINDLRLGPVGGGP